MSEDNMRLNLCTPLRSLVTNKFGQAHASQSLTFSETHLAILQSRSGPTFQLRYCPALSKKPKDNKDSASPPKGSGVQSANAPKRFDPFEAPTVDLLIARVPTPDDHTHNLVLNKFPVIANHFILATRANLPQTNLLEEPDLSLTYDCLRAWQDDQNSLYAFFNSGEHSGASQPHRHLQFLPVEDMRGSTSDGWDLLCHRMTVSAHPTLPLLHDPTLPVLHLATPLSSAVTASQLHKRYLLLLRAISILISYPPNHKQQMSDILNPDSLASTRIATDSGCTTISYNLALTSDLMAILPRRAEDSTIHELAGENDGSGTVSVNGTILAGTLMVKNENEWETIKAKPELLDNMLKQIGFPRSEMSRM